MLFSSGNVDDIKKYYQGTYIKIKEAGDALFYIQRVDRTQVSGLTEDGGEFIIHLDDQNPYEIDYVLPYKSYFQFERDAVQLFRSPAKQYQRGLNSQNTKLARVNQAGEMEALSESHLDFKILKAFVSKKPFSTLAQATSKTNPEGVRSFVLTPRMMFHRQTKGIFIDFIRVANVDVPTKTINMVLPVFKAEVSAFLKQTNETNEFKVV